MESPAIGSVKGLRGDILLELKRSQPRTAKELAETHGVTTNAVRRHLKELEAEHLVEFVRSQKGRGAPTFSYRLTAPGEALFPRRYEEQLTDVLTYLERRGGRQEIRKFFDEQFRHQADELMESLPDATLEDRVQAVVGLLQKQGFMAEWSVEGDTLRIAEHNCAVQAVAEKYPELCEAEVEFLRDFLKTDVQRAAYIPSGCNACEYAVALTSVHRSPPSEQA